MESAKWHREQVFKKKALSANFSDLPKRPSIVRLLNFCRQLLQELGKQEAYIVELEEQLGKR